MGRISLSGFSSLSFIFSVYLRSPFFFLICLVYFLFLSNASSLSFLFSIASFCVLSLISFRSLSNLSFYFLSYFLFLFLCPLSLFFVPWRSFASLLWVWWTPLIPTDKQTEEETGKEKKRKEGTKTEKQNRKEGTKTET